MLNAEVTVHLPNEPKPTTAAQLHEAILRAVQAGQFTVGDVGPAPGSDGLLNAVEQFLHDHAPAHYPPRSLAHALISLRGLPSPTPYVIELIEQITKRREDDYAVLFRQAALLIHGAGGGDEWHARGGQRMDANQLCWFLGTTGLAQFPGVATLRTQLHDYWFEWYKA